MIDAIISNHILPELSLEILSRMGTENKIKQIKMDIQEQQLSYEYLS